jgi:hypothetical protein
MIFAARQLDGNHGALRMSRKTSLFDPKERIYSADVAHVLSHRRS